MAQLLLATTQRTAAAAGGKCQGGAPSAPMRGCAVAGVMPSACCRKHGLVGTPWACAGPTGKRDGGRSPCCRGWVGCKHCRAI